MARKTVIAFFVTIFLFSALFAPQAKADFDCLTLSTSSSQSDKDFCRNELTQIEAQLADLVAKQKEQQKTTGTLKGDVNYLTSQINALKTKIKARALVIAQLKVNISVKVSTINLLSNKI
jgi:septal ring factor EnvC (AmiA/AmiB activator)